MTALHLARDLDIPLDAVTQKLAFLGRSGSGKTYAAGKLAEEMLDAGAQVVILDPVGTWYGLRLAAGGGGRGIEIPVLGGEHGDVPLEPAGGALVADTIVERATSAVVDVSRFRKGQRAQFVTDFAEQLFHRKKTARKAALHLIVEEAHVFIPQRTMHGQERLLGAMEDLVRLGRNFGIGVSLLSQRPQSVNKDALNQTEVLFALQLTGPHERAAVKEWIEGHGLAGEAGGKDLIRELPGLPIGEAWVWSPQFLRVLKRVKILKKRTYDTSATPDVAGGEDAAPVKPLGAKELEALRGAMAEVVKRAEDEDPKALRRRIAALERDLAAAKAAPAQVEVERVEVPVWPAEDLVRFETALKNLGPRIQELRDLVGDMHRRVEVVQAASRAAAARPTPPAPRPRAACGGSSFRASNEREKEEVPALGSGRSGAIRMLEALASAPDGLTRAQLGTLARMKVTGGSFGTYLSRLRVAGHLEEANGRIRATPAGLAAAGGARPPANPAEVRALWRPRLRGGAARMFDHLVAIAPAGCTREELAEAVEMEERGGSFGTYLSRLRANGLIEETDGRIFVAEALVG